jgi:branched-chain amino acid transport system ATP-binding protein
MKPILELKAVSKRFGAVSAVDRLDLRLEKGEALGVIGPNGAGKTTMFNIIAGGVGVDRGQVFFEGEEITRMPAFQRCRRGIARSYQIPHPFAGMSVFENLLVGATFGVHQAEHEVHRRCVGLLEQIGLLAKANVPAGRLTLLERKRLELGRALATSPKLLLLDEIAGGLTEHECRALVATVREIRSSGVSIIWIEHIVHALVAVVDRLMVINFGKKIEDGDPMAVIASPVVQEAYLGIEVDAP